MTTRRAKWLPVLFALVACGCAAPAASPDLGHLSGEIERRVGSGLGPASALEPSIPDGIEFADGVDEDEVVALALWNDPEFAAALAQLGIARADVQQAGLLRDPVLSFLFPLGPKQYEASLSWALDALWLRARRTKIAVAEAERIAEALVQAGLDLARDARHDLANFRLARERTRLAGLAAESQGKLARAAGERHAAGDAAPRDALLARAEAGRARVDTAAWGREAAVAEVRLRARLGLQPKNPPDLAPAVSVPAEFAYPLDAGALVADALAARPDLRAAEIAVEAAGERAGFAREEAWRIVLILDLNEKGGKGQEGKNGVEIGPGLSAALPIFDGGRGAEGRAMAEMEQAASRYRAVRRHIETDVRSALVVLEAAGAELRAWRTDVLPALDDALARGRLAWEAGASPAEDALVTELDVVAARVREVELETIWLRARADLDRNVGRRLDHAALLQRGMQ